MLGLWIKELLDNNQMKNLNKSDFKKDPRIIYNCYPYRIVEFPDKKYYAFFLDNTGDEETIVLDSDEDFFDSVDSFDKAIDRINNHIEENEIDSIICNHLQAYVDDDNFQRCQYCNEIID